MIKTHKCKGTCSKSVTVEISDGVIKSAQFVGGCDGNLKGVCALVTGMDAEQAAQRLEGIRCGFKNTSCPDQLSIAIREALRGE
ncbi:TIGR03905 family TSCPD domain-containing protein [Feifania hominis]|uniref:ribonucleoside-diphosphate reductase n=1 Tax=Feifania hominis TaxID=2763660 RepID=A0A926DDM6_9FIRM|nr:TIGR03905 family TSCPD domain-containing protein [Feifania hominis]MBC8535394.1 TIGR03905 family TSCPD domain-containing protein [Feifania hominis]